MQNPGFDKTNSVEEKKEEVEDVDMGGLFGGDDEYWDTWLS